MIAISKTGRLLRRLVRLSCRRPVVTTILSLLLAAAGIGYTLHSLTFKTSGRDLLPQNAGYVLRYNQYARDFGELEDIVIVIEARSFEAAKAYAADLVHQLRELADQVPARHLPHRPEAVRGAPAPLPPGRAAEGSPRQDLRLPGIHGELRG